MDHFCVYTSTKYKEKEHMMRRYTSSLQRLLDKQYRSNFRVLCVIKVSAEEHEKVRLRGRDTFGKQKRKRPYFTGGEI